MKVYENETVPHPINPNHYIQFGISTWTQDENEDDQEESIRRAVYNADGKFNPHSSSELPISDITLLMKACLDSDRIANEDMIVLLKAIAQSMERRNVNNA